MKSDFSTVFLPSVPGAGVLFRSVLLSQYVGLEGIRLRWFVWAGQERITFSFPKGDQIQEV